MSQENAPRGQEHQKQLESIREDLDKIAANKAEKELSKADREHGAGHQVEQLKYSAQERAVSRVEHSSRAENELKTHPVAANKQLKDISFQRALIRARKKLSAPSQVFSKIVHNKTVDATSEVIGNSVARPSAMLGGAFFALVGTSLLLWLTRRLGYEYNYLVVIILFGLGMGVGLGIEAIYRLRKKLK